MKNVLKYGGAAVLMLAATGCGDRYPVANMPSIYVEATEITSESVTIVAEYSHLDKCDGEWFWGNRDDVAIVCCCEVSPDRSFSGETTLYGEDYIDDSEVYEDDGYYSSRIRWSGDLQPNTTYWYRCSLKQQEKGDNGEVYAEVRSGLKSFTTLPLPEFPEISITELGGHISDFGLLRALIYCDREEMELIEARKTNLCFMLSASGMDTKYFYSSEPSEQYEWFFEKNDGYLSVGLKIDTAYYDELRDFDNFDFSVKYLDSQDRWHEAGPVEIVRG